jgi:hypothetical protein
MVLFLYFFNPFSKDEKGFCFTKSYYKGGVFFEKIFRETETFYANHRVAFSFFYDWRCHWIWNLVWEYPLAKKGRRHFSIKFFHPCGYANNYYAPRMD